MNHGVCVCLICNIILAVQPGRSASAQREPNKERGRRPMRSVSGPVGLPGGGNSKRGDRIQAV